MVAVSNSLQIAVDRSGHIIPIAFVYLCSAVASCVFENPCGVFGLVLVDDDVSFVIVTFADQPTKDAGAVCRIGDSALGGLAVPSGDVVLRDGTPEHVRAVCQVSPALNAGEESFDAGAVGLNVVGDAVDKAIDGIAYPHCTLGLQDGNKIFRAGEDKNIRLGRVFVTWQALVGFAGDLG